MYMIKALLFTALLLAPIEMGLAAQTASDPARPDDAVECACLRSVVRFDVSSVEKILLQPGEILEAPDRFWQEDGAYRLVSKWHTRIGQPPDLEAWKKRIEAIRDLPLAERERHSQLIAARDLAAIEHEFAAGAVPHVCAFLPPEADLSTTIYFTTEIMAAGFQESGDIVIHILNHELQNMFVHEVFHRGFVSVYRLSGNPDPETDPIRRMYLALQNEGLATYVAYEARTEFPQVGEVGRSLVAGDYDLLESAEEVDRLLRELGELLSGAPDMAAEELQQKSWEIGVNARAYYVVGAHMAATIDKALGRQALVGTIGLGPMTFLKVYNAVVAEDRRLPDVHASSGGI
jgi:uncharacterized damage-inducible protein DinB